MEANGNQRKRVGRLNKTNNNNGSMGPPQPVAVEDHEVLEVAALAISPTSEGETTSSNTPAAECRRSSRKKIIKFDVRDLLNKNRKPHKIQIEARIDSNAPATSKTFAAPAGEISSKSSLSGLADLSSKQKTFLEKSAIFRRYSISQEPKAPPPPLPLPPSLLGKGNDNKDLNSSDTTTTRRLSRTQEFFSNVMIKPKQTTSLIVAQMESSAPSQIATRKSVNTAIEIETKLPQAIDTTLTSLQKRRGRPSKNKIQSTEDTSKEDESIKKITPEKAKNWKEYKACLAQQTSDKEKTLETTNKTIPKSSEALTADVVLEISSSSSSHNSNIEDLNEKEELEMKSLKQTQTQEKNQEDSVQNFNILAEIIIEDTNSKDSVIKTTQTQEIIEKAPTEDKDIEITEALGTNPIKDNDKDKRDTQEQTKKDKVGVALEKDKDQLKEALEKESERKVLSITEVKEKLDYTLKDSQQTLKDKEKLETVSEIPQSSLKDTSRTRRQTKLSGTVAKEAVGKGKSSPTNLDAKLQQEEANKNEATGKNDHAEKGNQIPIVFEKANIEDSLLKEKESKENTAIDTSKQKDDSKNDQDAEVVAEKSVPPKKDVTTEKKPTKLDENLERDVKDDQSSKVMAITRRSRSKIDDTIAKETQPKASITPKETKSVKRNQTKLKDDMETPTNIQTLMSLTEKTKILQKDIDITEPTVSQVLQTDSAKEEALNKSSTNEDSSQKDSIPAKTAKSNVQLKTAQKVPIKLDDVLATTTNSEDSATESTRSRRSQYKRDDSIQNEKLIKTSDSEKIGRAKDEDSLLKDTASENQHTQKEEAVSLTKNSGKTGQTKENYLQIDTDSKTQKEEQVSASQKSVKRGQSKVEDSLQKSTDSESQKTQKEGKDSGILKAGQTELVDSVQNDRDSDAQQTQEVEKVSVTQKAGKRGQTKKEDFSQTDKDLEALQTQKDDKDTVAQKSGKRCQRKVEDSIQKATYSGDQQTQKEEKDSVTQKAGKRGQTKLEDSLQTVSLTQKEDKDSEAQKVGKRGKIKHDSSQTDKELEAPQIQNEEKDNIGEKAVKKSQKDKDSEDSQSNKEQEINKEKLEDDSLENQNRTKTFKQQTTGKRGQTKQKDSLATDIEPDAQKSQKEEKDFAAQKSVKSGQTKLEDSLQTDKLPEALQTQKEEKHSEAQKAGKRCSPKLKDSLQTDKEPEEKESVKQKAGKIGLTKREDALQKDEDSKATQSKPEQELVTKSLQSTKEKLDDLLQNENQTKTLQTIGLQKTRRRGQTKLEDSLQTNTVLENLQTQQDEKDSVTPQSTKDEEKAENIPKDTDNKDSSKDKDETDSKIFQTSKIEESVTTTPKDYSIDLEVFSKLDSSLQNENLSKATTEQNPKKKGQAKLEDSSSEDKKSETSQTDKKALDSKTSQSPKEEAGTTRKSTRKEAAAQKESKDECLKTDTVIEVIQSTKDEKRSRKAPAKLDDFVQNENITQTRKKGQIQITDALKKVTESKISPTDKQESDIKTSLTSTEDNGNKRKLTKKESSTQKDINVNKLLIDKDAEVTLSPKEDTKTRRSRSKLEDPIQTETSSTISKSAEEKICNKDKCTKNESSTKKEDKAANFTDKEDLQTDNNKKQPIKNKRNLKKLDQVIQKEEQEEDSQLTEFTEKTTLSSSQRLELKTPEPTASTIQIEQENTPTLKISTKDSTFSQESSLSQPSTPSEEKSLTFSRTSSSSESENFSERSSFSSATSSSTSSSGRSYKSGDKLRVSIKRFSLPKSPSTSSQTSTSEEQNSPNTTLNINKKKPPIAKRSKRLQKKSLDNQDATENIDDCFQKILTDEHEATGTKNTNFETIESYQEKQSVDEEKISSLKSTEKNKDVKTLVAQSPQTRNKKCNLIQKSNEQIKVKEAIEKQQIEAVSKVESTKISSKSQDVEAMIDLDKPTTSKGQSSTDVLTAVKRKSLRIRKDDSEEKDQENKEIMLKSTEENKTDAEKTKESELIDKEKIVETKQQPKKKIEEHEESLTETKQTEKRQLQDKLELDVEHEKKKESEKEEANQKKANRKEQEERMTGEKLQFKEIIEEKGKNSKDTQEKYNVEQELMSATTNKPIRGKRSPRSLTAASDKEQSPKSTTKLSELKSDASPKIIKSKKETTSTEILLDKDKDQTSFTSATSKTAKLSPVELKVSEPSKITSTRSKTGKTIPNQAMESPETLNKSSEKPNTPIEEANKKVSSESLASEQLKNISLSIKSATDITEAESTKVTRSRTGKTSPVEAADLSKNSDATEKESLKPNTKKSKQKISFVESSKMSPEDTVQETEVDAIEKESTKGSRQIIKKDMLPVEEKSLQNESMKTSSKKAKFETEANVNKKEISTIPTTKEIAAIEIQKTSILPLDINEQESSKKSKTEKDSSLHQLITTKETTKCEKETTGMQSPKFTASTKSTPDMEQPSSAKRKSLRNQKDKNNDDTTVAAEGHDKLDQVSNEIREETIISLNPTQKDVEKEKLDITLQETTEETIKIPKKRGRKPRFKNLHGPETESETEGSTGKQTPLDETMMAQRTYDLTPPPLVETDKSDDKVITKDNKLVKNAEFKESLSVLEVPKVTTPTVSVVAKAPKDVIVNANLEEKSKTSQDTTKTLLVTEKSERSLLNPTVPSETYLIKNVSIETNTLLDILRTVQSNTAAAALEATRKSDNKTEEIPASTKSLADTQMSETKSDDIPTTSQDRSLLSLKSLKKLDEDSNTNSPTRSDTASPYTLKKVTVSPARSDSSSPLTLIKVGQSPTRSDTSSPLTLKKVTRRYERRSRRGDDSAHKTLEETFAEIAAQSCKAVLAAKSFDINDEFIAQKTEQDKLEMGTRKFQTEQDGNEEKLQEHFGKPLHKIPDLESSSADVSKTSQDIKRSSLEVSTKPETTTEMSTLETSELNVSENDLETPESSKVTPVRRGRKPKNRITEVVSPITKDDTSIPKNKKDIEKSKDTLQAKETEQLSSSKDSSTVSPIKTTEYTIEQQEISKETSNIKDKSKITKESTKIIEISKDEENKQPDYNTESSVQLETQETHSKFSEDDSKSSKKLNKKRDANKESPITTEDNNTKQEDDIGTPKQTTKKRDSSLTKSETKSIGKKSTKKTKTNEDSSSPQKQDNTPKTTTPPPKRGRKPKNQKDPQQPTSSSKKKNKKETLESNDDENLAEKRKEVDSESESLNSSLDKSVDEKMAKKKRQKKLKEAFEAALTDDHNKSKEIITQDLPSSSSFGLTLLNKSPPPERDSFLPESIRNSCITPVEPEEDPDPLKDIEKFIADGVNLLKKDYKLDEDSVDDVLTNKTNEITETSPTNDDKPVFNTFETPADTPITTPSVTPPPKSPNSVESITPDENSGVRRSHRIKLITQTPKALVGRGLVRDKERFSIKDDVETKSHYTLDDHLMDLAEVEAKNAKFLKEMEERLSNFQVIKENDYLCERVISREARKMICDCFLTHEEEGRGELGCGEDCLNRLLMIECGPECNVKERCTNKRFQKLLCSPCRVFRTEKKGFGIMADIEILPGEFIMEYVGEVIDTEIFEQRRIMYSQDKNRHYYFMALRSDAIIDATIKGNISRFINHSCDPNAETQKWTVNGELRIGFFSRKSIMPGEEITFNYQYQRYGREAQRCYCESSNCRGWIGPEPTSDEGEQIDDDEDESEYDDDELEEEEAQVTATLLQPDDDDDEDSDASVVDPEEVQKKLEMAAAQAEVELAPIPIMEETAKEEVSIAAETTENDDLTKPKPEEEEEDSKSKFKKLLSIMAEKVAAKQKQNKREQKLQRKKKSKESSSELANKLRFLEDPDIEDEVEFLRECGLKNQSDTLRLSRLMVRAKLVQTRLNLLDILRKGDLPCRRLFLDYHGLRLVHGWMSEDAGNMQIRMALLQTLETLPIANKTVLTDSKVMQMVRNWCGSQTALSPNDDSSSSNSNSQDASLTANANLEEGSDLQELQKLALKLITTWEGLPEIFRIPKKERIEQMKEHEREADRQYAANAEKEENKTLTDRYRRDRFGKGLSSTSWTAASTSNRFLKPNNGNPLRNSNTITTTTPENNKNLSKAQRREMFAAKVARDEAEKRMAEERREFETKCRFFGLDPKKTRPQDVPFCVNPASGQWYSVERKPITTPPSYAHVQVPVKPKSTDPNDYQLPAACSNLPPQWKYAITPLGKIYYYHIKYRIPQWEPPTLAQLQQCEMEAEEEADSESELVTTAGEDSSEDDDEILIGMDAVQLRAYIDRKVESRRQKRYQRLVDQRPISPRREEDRIYNQIEVRKYKENKEKIRKRKEEIRRKRAEALRQTSLNMCTLGSIAETNLNAIKIQTESDEELGVLPIQDYLLSSDEEIDLKVEVNSPLIDKIVEGDKIVDELDALTSKRLLKRPLPPHRDLSEPSTSTAASTLAATTTIDRQEYKKRKLEKKEKRKPKDQDAKYRKNKEKFRCEIAGIIVHHLKPYRRDTCTIGRIQSNEDFNHLARKLTHFVMIKELKYCESVGQTLVVTESVKNKSREFIKKYMAKYRDVYIKPSNDPDFKDIPFTL